MHIKPSGQSLTAQNFTVKGSSVFINTSKTRSQPGMLLIHANYCGHCHDFIPTFNMICTKLNNYTCVSIESAELENQTTLVKALNFRGYPTICFFDNTGKIIGKYDGSRDLKSMLSTICNVYKHCI